MSRDVDSTIALLGAWAKWAVWTHNNSAQDAFNCAFCMLLLFLNDLDHAHGRPASRDPSTRFLGSSRSLIRTGQGGQGRNARSMPHRRPNAAQEASSYEPDPTRQRGKHEINEINHDDNEWNEVTSDTRRQHVMLGWSGCLAKHFRVLAFIGWCCRAVCLVSAIPYLILRTGLLGPVTPPANFPHLQLGHSCHDSSWKRSRVALAAIAFRGKSAIQVRLNSLSISRY
jgi:hypothetical protein